MKKISSSYQHLQNWVNLNENINRFQVCHFSGEQWGQITQKTKDMVLLPTEGKTLVGFGRRPSGLRDLDAEGKIQRGVKIGAPGFLRLTSNQDERSAQTKPWDMVGALFQLKHDLCFHLKVWFESDNQHKKAVSAQLVVRAFSQKV